MKKLFLILLLSNIGFAQIKYPKDYFRNPLDVTLVLSGTFAELRSNHFHSGLDIKTQQREGLKVYAAAEGFVSRIKISHYGYGKALYITHPNGYTTVYGHLQKFSPKIEAFIKAKQYENESYEIELFPNPEDLQIDADSIVAYSGNTGGSGGPHLHFEIRDNAERPINPMLFGITVKDSKAPFVSAVYAYPQNRSAHVNESNERIELRLIPNRNGDYSVEPIQAFGDIGFGIVSYDQQDLAPNKNGLSNIQSFFNGNKKFEIDFKRFSFDETKHLNRFIDYEIYKTKRARIQKLFVQSGNSLSMLKDIDAFGIVNIEDNTSSVYKARIIDFNGNEAWITIPIKGKLSLTFIEEPQDLLHKHYAYADQVTTFKEENISVYIPKNSLYDDMYLDFKVNSDTLRLHKDIIPLQKYFNIEYDISNYKEGDKNKLFIASLYGYYQRPSYINTTRNGDVLTARTKRFGTFTLNSDSTAPTIKAVNFQDGKWLSKYRYLKVKIADDLSGISNYRATINDKWILMEYDYKTGLLTYDFNDNVIKDTKNNLKIIVTDNVGNNTTFEATFFRK
ncbi:peptidase M23 [Flavobacteriales bacterium 34_180_T64]|nr:peptidase M23 [Flavobacteriales bacterium 34_180_T64]